MGKFIKRLALAWIASKLFRAANRRGHGSPVDGLLRQVDRHLRHGRGYGGHGHRGHYGYHGHYRRKRW